MSKSNPILTKDKRLAPGFRLFLMALPFLVLIFLFSYLPLYGWRYAFYDYRPPIKLEDCTFVGFKHITNMVQNAAMRKNLIRVLKNTLGMSILGMCTSWMPMVFAVFMAEIRNMKFQKIVQIVTTIPNFISWVIVYSIAFAIFSVGDGFVNNVIRAFKPGFEGIDFLGNTDHMWWKMWLWMQWKTIGYSAILYISSIAGIDQELYEAADIDGAGRFQKIRYITMPCLLPTYFTLLIINVGNMLNRGMDQYYAFQNPLNKKYIEVLALYVYNQGIAGSQISYSTAVGMTKSLISLVLLGIANTISKVFRDGQSIF